jgi:single-strand DNA-binding protein
VYETNVTVVGNVLTAPEWRRTANTNSLVANFKIASTARRLDRESGQWIDGNSLRVRVNCWRKLAEGVASSVMVGDPIMVVGRLYTRDWTDTDGNQRTTYEMEAVAVGHDLARGRGKFARNRPSLTTSAVEDAEADLLVRGETTAPVPLDEAPARPGESLFDDDPDFPDVPSMPAYDPIAEIRGGGFDASDPAVPGPLTVPEVLAPSEPAAALPDEAAPDAPSRPRRPRGRTPVPA